MSTPEKFCNRLARVRKSRGETQESLAHALGYTRSYISQLEVGLKEPGPHFLERFARWETETSEHTLKFRESAPDQPVTIDNEPSREAPNRVSGTMLGRVPIISWQAVEALQSLAEEPYHYHDYLPFTVTDPRAFSVPIKGDSMMPKCDDGDIAIIYPSMSPSNGDIVMARLKVGDLMFKVFSQQGQKILLTSYNPVYPQLEFDRDDFSWIFPAAFVVKPLKVSYDSSRRHSS